MSLETKMNLCKLGKEGEDEAHCVLESQPVRWGGFCAAHVALNPEVCVQRPLPAVFSSSKPRLSALADSDEESSSAGSTDEDEGPPCETPGSGGDKTTTEG